MVTQEVDDGVREKQHFSRGTGTREGILKCALERGKVLKRNELRKLPSTQLVEAVDINKWLLELSEKRMY